MDVSIRKEGRFYRRRRFAVLLLAPAVAVLAAMTLAVAVYVLYESFFRVGTFGAPTVFVGFDNYVSAFSAFNFAGNIVHTIFFVVVAVTIELLLGILLGIALAKKTGGSSIASGLLVIPFAMTPVVSAMVVRTLLNPTYGWIDYYLRAVGVTRAPIDWLGSRATAWIALIGLDVWEWTPFVALIVLAGYQSMNVDVLEASAVDGAGAIEKLRYIILPLLAPFVAIAGVLRVIQAFKTFDSFMVLTGGGPGSSTDVINLNIYRLVLQDFNIGAGAAMGVMFLIILLVLTPLLLRTIGKNTGLGLDEE